MSIESASAFYERVTTDQAFRTQLQNTASEERTAVSPFTSLCLAESTSFFEGSD